MHARRRFLCLYRVSKQARDRRVGHKSQGVARQGPGRHTFSVTAHMRSRCSSVSCRAVVRCVITPSTCTGPRQQHTASVKAPTDTQLTSSSSARGATWTVTAEPTHGSPLNCHRRRLRTECQAGGLAAHTQTHSFPCVTLSVCVCVDTRTRLCVYTRTPSVASMHACTHLRHVLLVVQARAQQPLHNLVVLQPLEQLLHTATAKQAPAQT